MRHSESESEPERSSRARAGFLGSSPQRGSAPFHPTFEFRVKECRESLKLEALFFLFFFFNQRKLLVKIPEIL
jgi:hypothetical protein